MVHIDEASGLLDNLGEVFGLREDGEFEAV
jgi:hypothetical protein